MMADDGRLNINNGGKMKWSWAAVVADRLGEEHGGACGDGGDCGRKEEGRRG